MNISSDYYSSSQSYKESLFSNDTQTLNSSLAGTAKTTSTQTTDDTTNTTSAQTTTDRETYGLTTLEQMTDDEYAAFERATATMSPSEKIQAAQSLHLVAKSFEQAQQMINGGSLVSALSDSGSQDSGYFQSNPDMLDKGISVLKEMSNSEGKSMASFLTRYKGALAGGGLNISA